MSDWTAVRHWHLVILVLTTSSQVLRNPFSQEVEEHPDPSRHMAAKADKHRMDFFHCAEVVVFQQGHEPTSDKIGSGRVALQPGYTTPCQRHLAHALAIAQT